MHETIKYTSRYDNSFLVTIVIKKIELKIRIINKKVVENREKLSTVGAPQSRNSFNTNKSLVFFSYFKKMVEI